MRITLRPLFRAAALLVVLLFSPLARAGGDVTVSVNYTSAPAPVPPNSIVRCDSLVNNNGPDAANVSISLQCPVVTEWSCSGSAGAPCQMFMPTGQSGFTHNVTMQANTSIRWTAFGLLRSGLSGVLTATVNAATAGDPDPGNNQASASIYLMSGTSSDMSAAILDAPLFVGFGLTARYLVEVVNHGPDPGYGGVDFGIDPLSAMSVAQITCGEASNGASCTATQWNTVNLWLPVGGRALIGVRAEFVSHASPPPNEQVAFSVHASGEIDPNPGNRSATVYSSIKLFADGFELD